MSHSPIRHDLDLPILVERLVLQNDSGLVRCIGVDLRPAQIVEVAPHLSSVATFAVHLSCIRGRFTVSNVETGHSVAHGKTLRGAVRQATDRLSLVSVDVCEQSLDRAHKMTGRVRAD